MDVTKPVILVAGDEPDSLRLRTGILGDEGYELRSAERGRLALASAVACPPGLVPLDLHLPGKDGLELCRRLMKGERTRGTLLMFIRSAAGVEQRVQGLAIGAADSAPVLTWLAGRGPSRTLFNKRWLVFTRRKMGKQVPRFRTLDRTGRRTMGPRRAAAELQLNTGTL
ncbi:MAG: response regulator [Bryobacteraceae bacterium]|nr:response regulator [Bryobacteraceae bacterium]